MWLRDDTGFRWLLHGPGGRVLAEVTDRDMIEADSLPALAAEVFRTAGSCPPALIAYLGG